MSSCLLKLSVFQGVGLSDSPALITGGTAKGSAKLHDKWSEFSVTATLAEEVTVELAEVLDKRRVDHCLLSMEGLAEGASGVRLGWGEVVPLWFLSEVRGTSGTRKRVVPYEVVVLCSPRPRACHSSDLPDLLDQCVSLGEEVGDVLEQWEQRVVVVVPGGLCSDHRGGEQAFMQWPPLTVVGRGGSSGGERGLAARRAQQLDDQIEHWVRNTLYTSGVWHSQWNQMTGQKWLRQTSHYVKQVFRFLRLTSCQMEPAPHLSIWSTDIPFS